MKFLAIAVLILGGWAYGVGRLLWMVAGSTRVVSRATRRARAELRRELAALTSDELRSRLIHYHYFTEDVRRHPGIQQFLSRIERHDEVAIAAELPHAKLYRLLADAELAAGRRGRPEAVDAIDSVSAMLQALAIRARP